MSDIAIIDYGVGNLLSVKRAFQYCETDVVITSDPKTILNSSRVVLPGVGAFLNGMKALEQKDLISTIHKLVANEVPLLAICLGMQMLLEESEEFGISRGLGIIPGRVVPIPKFSINQQQLKVPHIGWSELEPAFKRSFCQNGYLKNFRESNSVYFVHSFMASPESPTDIFSETIYGGHRIPAIIGRGSVIGCQFHPEKSGKVGIDLIQRFINWKQS